jgi:S-DNA-T family DNA segregation ATPase FtsK/SpoIIIE
MAVDTTQSNASLYEAPDIDNQPTEILPPPVVDTPLVKKSYPIPDIDLLTSRTSGLDYEFNERVTLRRKEILEQKLASLNVDATIIGYEIGPSVTSFDVQMADGVQTQQVKKVLLDLGVALGGYEVAFHDIVLGKTCSTIEVMNERASMVGFKEMLLDLRKNEETHHKFMIPFGRNIKGDVIAFTPKDMIHLLVAGSSGSGKTVFMHTFIMTILLQTTPEQARMLLIDPKKFELAKYKNQPHLLCPVITEMDEAKVALERLVDLMEERYLALQDSETSSLDQYNRYASEHGKATFPLIFAIIDEYNDLINTHPQVSDLVARLAQKARAAGIHLMIATQRPTTDIITGSIKNNMATIVALRVAKQVDSVTVLGHAGAEILGGNGDMYLVNPLFARQGEIRVQGAYVSEDEISRVCASIRNAQLPSYDERFLNLKETTSPSSSDGFSANMEYSDPMYDTIKSIVMTMDYVSMNWIARTYEMGYPRALRLFKMLQNDGVVDASDTSPQNNKGRKVLLRVDDPGRGL